MKLTRSRLKRLILEEITDMSLVPSVEEDLPPATPKETFLPDVSAWSRKASSLFSMLQSTQMGQYLTGVTTQKTSPSKRTVRIGAKFPSPPPFDIVRILNDLQCKMRPDIQKCEDTVVAIPPRGKIGPGLAQKNYSGRSTAYYLPYLNINLTFGASGSTDTQRGGGYEYENSVYDALATSGTPQDVTQGEDNHVTDVFVQTPCGRVGIEVKKQNAQAGEPTFYYNYKTNAFIYKGRNDQAKAMAAGINAAVDASVIKRMNAIKGCLGFAGEELTGVSTDQYFNVLRCPITPGPLADSAVLIKFAIDPAVIRNYYTAKGAAFVQVQDKGLYHINTPLTIGGKTTQFFNFSSPQGLVYLRNVSDTRYAMRTQFKGNPFEMLEKSLVDLDNAEDREAFLEFMKSADRCKAYTSKETKKSKRIKNESSRSQMSIYRLLYND